MKTRDRVIGIVLGVVAGIGIVTGFVFLGSEQTVDAPGVNAKAPAGGPTRARANGTHRNRPKQPPKVAPVATVRVIGGAPPPSGPAQLHYRQGQRVRLRVVSDETVGVQLLGYGIDRTVSAGQPGSIVFRASRRGNFPLIVAASHIAVAQIGVGEVQR